MAAAAAVPPSAGRLVGIVAGAAGVFLGAAAGDLIGVALRARGNGRGVMGFVTSDARLVLGGFPGCGAGLLCGVALRASEGTAAGGLVRGVAGAALGVFASGGPRDVTVALGARGRADARGAVGGVALTALAFVRALLGDVVAALAGLATGAGEEGMGAVAGGALSVWGLTGRGDGGGLVGVAAGASRGGAGGVGRVAGLAAAAVPALGGHQRCCLFCVA